MGSKITSFEEYKAVYNSSIADRELYWAEQAESFDWHKKWDTIHSGSFEEGNVKWYEGGKLNITENCLDRHLDENGDKVAFHFEANDPDEGPRSLTYRELHEEVCKFANVLESKGVEKGDRVAIYMAMTPEIAIATLACARIGAVHSIVFAGFSAQSLADRIQDCDAKMLITNDGLQRGTKLVPLKDISDEAVEHCPTIENVIVCKRTENDIDWEDGRDEWWHDLMEDASSEHEAVEMDAEDPLFILYTSGSTGAPKGQLHTCGGYMVYVSSTLENVFQVDQDDVYWCTADAGWITGHSYIIYGPLLNGLTGVIFESTPMYPDPGRLWQVVDKYDVTHFYTSPTAIRALMKEDIEYVQQHDLSSIEVLGTVGEPINEEAWHWYHDKIGNGKCPIVDTWWQTETGGMMISPMAGITPTKPGYATLPLPGIEPALMDDSTKEEIKGNGVQGDLVIKQPWPGMTRGVWGDEERYMSTYFEKYPGYYFTGDGCKRDEDGYYRITGRVDDVLNVSGHRLGTAEIENAIDEHNKVVEAAIVGYPHDVKGEGIYAFMTCDDSIENPESFKKEIHDLVSKIISPIAKPDKIQIVEGLPKTRSGKIMRRILRQIAAGEGDDLGDTSTLVDPSVVDEIRAGKAY